jgi:hypothetical protein
VQRQGVFITSDASGSFINHLVVRRVHSKSCQAVYRKIATSDLEGVDFLSTRSVGVIKSPLSLK